MEPPWLRVFPEFPTGSLGSSVFRLSHGEIYASAFDRGGYSQKTMQPFRANGPFRRPKLYPRSRPSTSRYAKSGALVLFAVLALGVDRGTAVDPPQRVASQLNGRPPFQFTGYYAALEQGSFAEEGLNVTIREGSADHAPLSTGVLGAVVVLALLGALVLAWNRQLRRVVGDRTEELRQAAEEIGALTTALEERVREGNAQVEVANRELEAFAYSVSHDLRAPLRHLRGYAKVLIEDHGAELSEPGRGYVDRIGAAAEHMNEVVDALLGLSRLSSGGMSWSPVDLSALAEDVAAELRRNQPARDVSFEIAPEVFVEGDPRLLRQAMQNLLENAWKYTSKHPSARIEFGVDDRAAGAPQGNVSSGARVFYVRDDGAGFDGRQADQLFRPFRRMHAPSEFEGTGIGLATVQRIVQRHRGRIWAEAAPEQGATFYFTLAGTNGARVDPPR